MSDETRALRNLRAWAEPRWVGVENPTDIGASNTLQAVTIAESLESQLQEARELLNRAHLNMKPDAPQELCVEILTFLGANDD